ncbi:unnamed protein product [Adineta steineri]|uniref:Glutathione S-transferase n=1 Tax=Adineta steineri TaxID=433720 RepID=A0A818UGI4_9BILA|nr:unnamed protein product [Adineta steineri]CAF3698060.1 unnamed protein product [Adineta steineri]
MMNNPANYYTPPYGTTAFSGMPNYGAGSPPVPYYYNVQFPQQQATSPLQQQQKPEKQQKPKYPHAPPNQKNNENISLFKLYDIEKNRYSTIIRLIFSFVGVPYKEKHFKPDELSKIKEKMPYQQLPILRVHNQFKIFQLHAIIRYLAREFNLYGRSKHDQVVVDDIVEIARQFQEKIFEQINNSTNYEQSILQFIIDSSVIYLKQLEGFFAIFDHHGPFYLGLHISLADLMVYDVISYLIKVDGKLLDSYSHLKEARRQLEKHPGVADFIQVKTPDPNKSHHHHKSPHTHRRQTKSPTPNSNSQQQQHHHHRHHHHHRRRSVEGGKSNHHHHHHYHCPYHRRKNSKEPTPSSQTKQPSIRSSKSPSILINEKESTPLPSAKQQIIRQSKSPNPSRKDKESPHPSRKDKESTPLAHIKQRLIRSSASPGANKPEKKSTTISANTTLAKPPVIQEDDSESITK